MKSEILGAPGSKYANSPRNENTDSTSVSMFGSLLTNRVKKGTSVEKFAFTPNIELFIGSELYDDF